MGDGITQRFIKMNVTFKDGHIYWVNVPLWWVKQPDGGGCGKAIGDLLVVDEDGQVDKDGKTAPDYQLASLMRLADSKTDADVYEQGKAFGDKVAGCLKTSGKYKCVPTLFDVKDCSCGDMKFGMALKEDKNGEFLDMYVHLPVRENGFKAFADAQTYMDKAVELIKKTRPVCDESTTSGSHSCQYGDVSLTLRDTNNDGKDDYADVVLVVGSEITATVHFYGFPYSMIEGARQYNIKNVK